MSEINIIPVSGGKDSTACALISVLMDRDDQKFVFADTGHEHPQTYDYMDYLNGRLIDLCGVGVDVVKADFSREIKDKRGRLISALTSISSDKVISTVKAPAKSEKIISAMIDALQPTGIPFLDLCLLKGRFPGTRSRFCTDNLKHKPLMDYQLDKKRGCDVAIVWQGVRRDESRQRAALKERDIEFGTWDPEPDGLLIWRPIIDWTADECFKMLKRFNVKPNPLYSQGMGRVGCMPCIHSTKAEMREISRRFPSEVRRVAEWERLVSASSANQVSVLMDARVSARYLGTGKTVDDLSHETHGINTYCEWSKTEYGGKQSSLIAAIDELSAPGCSSIYGLCE